MLNSGACKCNKLITIKIGVQTLCENVQFKNSDFGLGVLGWVWLFGMGLSIFKMSGIHKKADSK